MKKKNCKKEKVIDVIVCVLKNALLIENNFFANHENYEYMENIGTIYKRSVKESNKVLRFKERFKWKYQIVLCMRKYGEVI